MSERTWIIENNDYSYDVLRDKNTVYTICNGYYAIKGNVHEYKNVDYPATYIAGVWGHCPIFKLERPTKYKRIYHDYDRYDIAEDRTSIANLPDPLMLEIYIDNSQLTFKRGQIENFSQKYFMKSGLYRYEFIYTDEKGRKTAVRMDRFADMINLHRAYMRYTIKPLNYNAVIRINSGIDGTTKSNALDEKQYAVITTENPDSHTSYMKAKTFPNNHEVEIYTSDMINIPDCTGQGYIEEERIYNSYVLNASENQEIVLDKFIVLGSSEDDRYNVAADLAKELEHAKKTGIDAAHEQQNRFWTHTWKMYDVIIEGDELAQMYMRFCMFHLACGLPRHSNNLFMPVKLLTGDHYQGTAFYDTDLYIEPVFLAIDPVACRELITFRYNILDKSREIAASLGYPGAKYAWQVDPLGNEILGSWWILRETNIHLNVDIVYSIMQYYYSTGDIDFMINKAIDVMVEVSRFMKARSEYDPVSDTYSIDKVAGPDEAHCNSRNNFYTNYLTKQCWLNTASLLDRMKTEFSDEYRAAVKRLAIKEEEPASWKDAAEKIVILFDPESKLYEQAEGFFKLPMIPEERWERFKIEHKPKAGMWFADLDKYCQTNQPDASALIWMYPHHFDDETYRANYEYYNERNCNFSSMSFVVNSMMAKRVGDMEAAYKNFVITAGMDIDPTLTNRMDTRAGLHGTALAGGWMAVVYGFAGITITENGLIIEPRLPAHWTRIAFKFNYMGELFQFDVTQNKVEIKVENKRGIEAKVNFHGNPVVLKSGNSYTLAY